MDFGVASFVGITVIAYLAGMVWKTSKKLDDEWIPCVCGVLGCVLGIVAFYIKVPDFPANDVINAAAVGIVSGFSATAINQIGKQLKKLNAAESDAVEETVDEDSTESGDAETNKED